MKGKGITSGGRMPLQKKYIHIESCERKS